MNSSREYILHKSELRLQEQVDNYRSLKQQISFMIGIIAIFIPIVISLVNLNSIINAIITYLTIIILIITLFKLFNRIKSNILETGLKTDLFIIKGQKQYISLLNEEINRNIDAIEVNKEILDTLFHNYKSSYRLTKIVVLICSALLLVLQPLEHQIQSVENKTTPNYIYDNRTTINNFNNYKKDTTMTQNDNLQSNDDSNEEPLERRPTEPDTREKMFDHKESKEDPNKENLNENNNN